MIARLTAWLVWALLAASVVFWGLTLFVRPMAAPAYVQPVATTQAARGDAARLFASAAKVAGSDAPAPASSRFKLLGVMAPAPARGGLVDDAKPYGLALIAIDGKPARAFPVGAKVDGDWVLQEVTARGANLGPAGGGPAATLQVPPLPAAATGTLGGFAGRPGMPVPVVPQPVQAPVPAFQPNAATPTAPTQGPTPVPLPTPLPPLVSPPTRAEKPVEPGGGAVPMPVQPAPTQPQDPTMPTQ